MGCTTNSNISTLNMAWDSFKGKKMYAVEHFKGGDNKLLVVTGHFQPSATGGPHD